MIYSNHMLNDIMKQTMSLRLLGVETPVWQTKLH